MTNVNRKALIASGLIKPAARRPGAVSQDAIEARRQELYGRKRRAAQRVVQHHG